MIGFAEFTMSYGGRRIAVIPTQVCSVQDISNDGMIRTAVLCVNGSEHVIKESYEQVVAVLSLASGAGHLASVAYWDDSVKGPQIKKVS